MLIQNKVKCIGDINPGKCLIPERKKKKKTVDTKPLVQSGIKDQPNIYLSGYLMSFYVCG